MKNYLDMVKERRSIRQYTDQKISEDQIKELLTAGMYAPSAGNAQPWDFIVIDDQEILKQIPNFHPYSTPVLRAPISIIICGNLEKEKYKDYWVQDCAAATMNIHMTAHAMGLGSVWMGVFPVEERVKGIRNLIGAPDHVMPLSILSIGYPAEERSVPNRYSETMIHKNKW